MVYLLKMVIVHSYVSLPEGIPRKFCFKPHCHPRVDLRKGAPEESHTLRLEKEWIPVESGNDN